MSADNEIVTRRLDIGIPLILIHVVEKIEELMKLTEKEPVSYNVHDKLSVVKDALIEDLGVMLYDELYKVCTGKVDSTVSEALAGLSAQAREVGVVV